MEMKLIRLYLFLIVLMPFSVWSSTVVTDTPSSKIIGGVDSTDNYPWMVSIQRGFHFCGGVLIGKDWVLTAAHCLDNKEAGDLTLYIGLDHLSLPASGEVRKAEWFLIHPDYNDRLFYSDIAIIKLDRSSTKKPISILSRDATLDLQQNEQLKVLGWGVTDSGEISRQLQEVEVSYQSDPICAATYAINGIDHYWQRSFCAGEVSGGKDSCQGDSGGPIIVKAQDEWALTGLVSWGSGCAEPGLYGVYTEVSSMSEWIDTRRAGVTLFGNGLVGFLGKDRQKAQRFTLQNLSDEPQAILNKSVSNYYFSIDDNNWLLGDSIPASQECEFTVNAEGDWAGEHYADLKIQLNNNSVYEELNAKVLSRVDGSALGNNWEYYSGTTQNTEHSKPWVTEIDDEYGEVMASSNNLSGTRSVLLTYLNGPIGEENLFLKFNAKVSDANLSYLKLFINEKGAKTVDSAFWGSYAVPLEAGVNHTMFIFFQSGGGTAYLDNLRVCTDRFNESTCSQADGYFNVDELGSLDDPDMTAGIETVCTTIDYEDSEIKYVSRTSNDVVYGSNQVSTNTTTSYMLGDRTSGGGALAWVWLLLLSTALFKRSLKG